jgi:hypothetical protein
MRPLNWTILIPRWTFWREAVETPGELNKKQILRSPPPNLPHFAGRQVRSGALSLRMTELLFAGVRKLNDRGVLGEFEV